MMNFLPHLIDRKSHWQNLQKRDILLHVLNIVWQGMLLYRHVWKIARWQLSICEKLPTFIILTHKR